MSRYSAPLGNPHDYLESETRRVVAPTGEDEGEEALAPWLADEAAAPFCLSWQGTTAKETTSLLLRETIDAMVAGRMDDKKASVVIKAAKLYYDVNKEVAPLQIPQAARGVQVQVNVGPHEAFASRRTQVIEMMPATEEARQLSSMAIPQPEPRQVVPQAPPLPRASR